METAAPAGVRFRPATADDLDAAARILAAEETAVRGRTQWTPDVIGEWWRLIDHDCDSCLATVGGRPIAVGVLLRRDDLFDTFGGVEPEFWERGIGSAVLARSEARAQELGAAELHHAVYVENDRARRLLERVGFRPVRHYCQMEIELDSALPQPVWPAGLEAATFAPEDARAFHAALTEAFADEWRFVPMSFENWKRIRLEAPGADTSLWFVVRDGEETAAAVRCDGPRAGGGWIGALAVRKAWRRRGLGLALLHHAFRELRRRGLPRASLGVDAANSTGATRLYERAGMTVALEDIVYGKELG